MIFLFLALATWRTASMLVYEEGPFGIFYRLRVASGLMYDQNHEVLLLIPDNFFAQLLSCIRCATIWTGISWTVAYLLLPDFILYISLPFALSALAIGWDKLVHNGV